MNFLKILVIGDNNTGKTSLIQKITTKKFNFKTQIPTLGLNFYKYNHVVQNHKFQLEFWDFSGSKEYLPMLEIYYKDCDIIVICFDISEQKTIDSINNYWLPILNDFNNIKEKQIIIIGNKNDLQKETYLNANLFTKKNIYHEILYFSAKNETNFTKFINLLIGIYCSQKKIILQQNNKKGNSATNFVNFFKNLFKKKSY